MLDYKTKETPADYTCRRCGALGFQLWRKPHSACADLLCRQCAVKEWTDTEAALALECEGYDSDGWFISEGARFGGFIGDRVRAIPTPECENYWAAFEVPLEASLWFARLGGPAWYLKKCAFYRKEIRGATDYPDPEPAIIEVEYIAAAIAQLTNLHAEREGRVAGIWTGEINACPVDGEHKSARLGYPGGLCAGTETPKGLLG